MKRQLGENDYDIFRKKFCKYSIKNVLVNKSVEKNNKRQLGDDNDQPRKKNRKKLVENELDHNRTKNNNLLNQHFNCSSDEKYRQKIKPRKKKFRFERVCGIKKNSICIYVPKQKLMYVQNVKNKAGQKTYICYNYKKQKCLSRMVEIFENICQPTINSKPHTCIGNHEQFLLNCKLLRDIKNRALEINKAGGTEAFKISTQAIIDQEKSK